MKKYIIGLLLLSTVPSLFGDDGTGCPSSCECEITSRSFLTVRSHFHSWAPEYVSAFRYDRNHAKPDGIHGAVQFVVFGSQSTNPCDLARYFFPFCKTSLIVDERILVGLEKDLLAEHFNIFTRRGTFRSIISIAPKQSVVGFGVHYRQSFYRNEEKGRGFWGSISFPIEKVINDLRLREFVEDDGGGPDLNADVFVVGNMIEALNQADWNFGKIGCKPCSRTGVADIEFKLGYEWLQNSPCHLESYLGVLAPTGTRPTGEFMFEPTVGNNGHIGVMFGSSVGIEIWKDEIRDRNVRVEYAFNTQYLFSRVLCRSVDLKCKPWTRYIELYANKDQAIATTKLATASLRANFATPGINILTLPLKITPGFQYNGTTAVVFTCGGIQVEAGYNLFARQSECARLNCPWVLGPAIKHHDGNGETNPIRDITGNFRLEDTTDNITVDFYDTNVIQEADLDLVSATTPCAISQTLYGAGGYRWDTISYPVFVSAGGSFEFSNSNNSIVDRWTIWAKGGISF